MYFLARVSVEAWLTKGLYLCASLCGTDEATEAVGESEWHLHTNLGPLEDHRSTYIPNNNRLLFKENIFIV